jgi:uncharacterized coiled-coil DUF342 family protein
MDYEAKIKELKDGLEKAKNKRIQAATRLEELAKQEKQYLAEARELGVDPDRLDEEIANLQDRIEKLSREIEALIPWDLIKN